MGTSEDTIAAIATPPGRGGIGIVRISGPAAAAIARTMLGRLPAPRRALRASFRDAAGEVIDSGLALYFPGPASFTGEDVLELHGHGGPVVMDLLLARVLECGARPARPGEFSERAFLNGRIDLAQAEAIADLIDSASAQAARSAQRTLAGELSRRVHALVEELVALRSFVEAAIDFPEEEIDFLSDRRIGERLAALREALAATLAEAQRGALLREGLTVVIAGRPNVGKSSLLNRLSRRDSAIVTEIPGTTRDLLREHIHIEGLPLQLIDTAGLRVTADPVEQQGVGRAREALRVADAVLLLVEDAAGEGQEALPEELGEAPCVVLVRNKIDLSGRAPRLRETPRGPEVCLSAKTGAGLELLEQALRRLAGQAGGGEGGFSARRRHLDALGRAAHALADAGRQLAGEPAGELLAEDLRQAQRALGEITGEFSSEDLLERIFSSFCIGK